MAGNVYSALPLNLDTKEIRLVRFLPSSTPSSIACEFERYSLYDAKLYIALSYTWGDVTSTVHEITVDGYPIFVRQNLWYYLQQLHSLDDEAEGHSVALWIDALCIDQSNIQERSHQVGLMREVFSKVSQCVSPSQND